MTDRLKQIWGGFESVTTRHLTGRGVDNIITPRRRDYKAEDASFLPEGFHAPAQAAFEALRAELAVKEHKANAKGTKGETRSLFEAELNRADGAAFADAPAEAKDMLRGLKSTEDRVLRSEMNYAADMSAKAGDALKSLNKRKKFLGIF